VSNINDKLIDVVVKIPDLYPDPAALDPCRRDSDRHGNLVEFWSRSKSTKIIEIRV